jgi:pyruvate/2-oxoglutarate dehydrogenase complex dihydrolipoamide acyltransferase (E2) component
MKFRSQLNKRLEPPRGVKLSVNDFIACALALQRNPEANALFGLVIR